MHKNREFLALFIIFVLVFSLLSIFTEQRLRAFDVQRLVPRIYVAAPQRDRGLDAAGNPAVDDESDFATAAPTSD